MPVLAMIVLAWMVLWLMYVQHSAADQAGFHAMHVGWADFFLMVLMWWCMALAMMLPSALPAVQTLEELTDTAAGKGEVTGNLVYFICGFLVLWFGFGLLAAAFQWVLQQQWLLNAHAASNSLELNAALLILAGAYQWTPWKHACISKCRAPMTFFMMNWQTGNSGYWSMGNRMGLFCLGCCWAMMLLMFVMGVMNLVWMGLLSVYMYAEKNWIKVAWFDRATGALLLCAGAGVLLMSRIN